MDPLLFIAAILGLIAFFAHAFVGDKEFRLLRPNNDSNEKTQETWIQTRAGWHWVSIDLLLSSLLLFLFSTTSLLSNIRTELLSLLSLYFLICSIVWLAIVLLSKNKPKQILVLGQWIFCFIMSTLIYLSI